MGLGGVPQGFRGRRILTSITVPLGQPIWTHRLYANYTRGTVSERWPQNKTVRTEGARKSKGNGPTRMNQYNYTPSTSSGQLECVLISSYMLPFVSYMSRNFLFGSYIFICSINSYMRPNISHRVPIFFIYVSRHSLYIYIYVYPPIIPLYIYIYMYYNFCHLYIYW